MSNTERTYKDFIDLKRFHKNRQPQRHPRFVIRQLSIVIRHSKPSFLSVFGIKRGDLVASVLFGKIHGFIGALDK
jgi:hypothetical protein